jgi:hypothetical protein
VDEEEEALLAVVASGAALGADAAKVVASEDVDEEVDVESMDETEAVPVTSRGAELRPPAPSSVDPMGIPTRPTGAPAAMPVGDEADAVGEARLGPAVQVPDVVPVVPPSNTVAMIIVKKPPGDLIAQHPIKLLNGLETRAAFSSSVLAGPRRNSPALAG